MKNPLTPRTRELYLCFEQHYLSIFTNNALELVTELTVGHEDIEGQWKDEEFSVKKNVAYSTRLMF